MNLSSLSSSPTSHVLPRLSSSLHPHHHTQQQQQSNKPPAAEGDRDFTSRCSSSIGRKPGSMGEERGSDGDGLERQSMARTFCDYNGDLQDHLNGSGVEKDSSNSGKDGSGDSDAKSPSAQQFFSRAQDNASNLNSVPRDNGELRKGTESADDLDEGGKGENGVGCTTCQEEFPTMEAYVSHVCVPATVPSSAPSATSSSASADRALPSSDMDDSSLCADADRGDGSKNGSDHSADMGVFSDIKSFMGHIVYNPDGSAYVIEDDGESDDSNLSLLDMPKVEGAIVDRTGIGAGSSSPPIPQIASAVFVARPFSSWSKSINSVVPDSGQSQSDGVPIMHNFRVYNVRSPQASGEVQRGETDDSAQSPLLPAKPILMCFMCKLSFGLPSSFISHARVEHVLELNEEERTILARPKASAIIQGVGKEKTPLMSFLELLPSTSSKSKATHSTISPFSCSGASTLKAASAPTKVKYMYTSPRLSKEFSRSPTSGCQDRTSDEAYSMATGSDPCPPIIGENNVHDFTESPEDRMTWMPNEDRAFERSESQHQPKNPDLADREGQQQQHPTKLPFSTSSAFSADRNDILVKQEPSNFPTSQELPQDYVSPASTPMSMFPGAPLGLPMLAGGTCDEHPLGRVQGTECSKCDMVLGSAQSLGGHMTMMHSRNSSKTLKCPRCNWHYKYQETLEIHMKEKHPDNDAQCIYCVTNQPHPRLARGETYSCGYKPYHCPVCNYSTTTKGNLTIHMQSDKHINNMQEFTNGGSDMTMSTNAPSNAPPAPPKPVGVSADEALKKKMSKQPYRCDLCNYETAVARNMRIHNTSEKHNHNMMLMQQNMKRDMHNLHMGQLMMDPMFALNPGSLPPAMYPYDQSMMMPSAPPFYDMAFGVGRENGSVGEDVAADMADASMLYHCTICGLHSTDSLEALHHHLNQDRTKQNETDNIAFENGTYTCLMCQYKTSLKANFQLHCKTDKHLQRLQLTNHIREGGLSNEWRLNNLSATSHQVRCNACNFYTSSVHKLQVHVSQMTHESNAHVFRQLQMAVGRLQSQSMSSKPVGKVYYRCVLCGCNTRTKQAMLRHTITLKHMRGQQTEATQRTLDPRDFFIAVELKDGDSVIFEESDGERGRKAHAADRNLDAASSLDKLDHLTGASSLSSTTASKPTAIRSLNNNGILELTTKGQAGPLTSDKTQTDVIKDPSSSASSQGQGQRSLTPSSRPETELKASLLQCPLCQDECQGFPSLENHLAISHKVTPEGMQKLLNMEIPTVVRPPSGAAQEDEVTAVENAGSAQPMETEPALAMTSSRITLEEKMELDVERLEQQHERLLAQSCMVENSSGDKAENDETYHCRICARTFSAIDDLYAHQNELGHLELKQTPRGPGYLCWKKGCNQYFKTAQALQEHFKHIHVRKNDKEGSAISYKCHQCSSLSSFRDEASLHFHNLYHLAKAITQCSICLKCFTSVQTHKSHLQKEHGDLSQSQLEELLNAIDKDMASLTHSAGFERFLVEYLGCEQTNSRCGSVSNIPPSEHDAGNVVEKNTQSKKKGIDALAADIARKAEEQSRGLETTHSQDGEEDAQQLEKQFPSQQSLEEFINSQAMPMTVSEDLSRKYVCQRCRVSFTRQSYLILHKKTQQHQRGNVLSSYTLERYMDPSRPYKCEVCKESFTQKNILLSHYNSVSHLHTLKASKVTSQGMPTAPVSKKPAEQVSSNGISSNAPSGGCSDRASLNRKSYKCNVCNVAFTDLDSHQRTTSHQTRLNKFIELMATGQVSFNQPLIEHPDMTGEAAQMQQMQMYMELMQHQQMSAVSSQSLMLQAMQSLNSFPVLQGMPPMFSNPPTSYANSTTAALASYASAAAMERELQQQSQSLEKADKHDDRKSEEAEKETEDSKTAKSERLPMEVDDAEDKCDSMTIQTELEEDSMDDGISDPSVDTVPVPQAALKSEMSTNTSDLCMPNMMKSSDQPSNPVLAASLPVVIARPRGFMGRFKPQIHRNLLENIGFEYVMQFNEASQHRRKEKEKGREEKEKSRELEEETQDGNIVAENEEDPTKQAKEPSEPAKEIEENQNIEQHADLPEINKCCCPHCGSEFSSVFVLKAHEEAVHKKVIPINLVEEFGEMFKSYFEEKQPKPDPEPLSVAHQSTSAAVQPVTSQITTVTTSTSTASSTEKVPVKASKDEMPPPPPPPPQLPSPYDMAQMMPMLGMMPMPMNLMGLQAPLVPMLPGTGLDIGSGFPLNLGLMDPSLMSAQQQIQQAANAAQNQKRVRTRISDEQLKILRAHFDINNSPTEAQINQMSEQSGLPQKVIKHWFRNTLFKERQRNKDSPYNFNIPPSTTIDLEEYEKTGKIPATAVKEEPCDVEEAPQNIKQEEPAEPEPQPEPQPPPPPFNLDLLPRPDAEDKREHESHSNTSTPSNVSSIPSTPTCSAPPTPTPTPTAAVANILDVHAMALAREAATQNSVTKRANRTRFTDAQVKMLQEYFEQNAYPKDDELDHLSKMLNLSPRVIVVWFQNARQKARKIYENQPAAETKESGSPFQRTASLNYLCKKCGAVFQRYYELIKHQKRPCLSENNNNKPLPPMTDDDSLSSGTSLDDSGLSDMINLSMSSQKETISPSAVSKAVRCDKCNISFSRIDLWQEHQKMHDLNSNLFPPFSSSSAFGMLQSLAQQEDSKSLVATAPMASLSNPTFTYTSSSSSLGTLSPTKRKLEVSDDDRMDDQPRDKRLRTTILPEQLDYLYQKYQLDCNPSRKQLESISQEVGLKKRVVQVWFQNTRARERKGQYRAHQQLIHKRCPFCRALFRAKSAMESHLATKHPEEMAKGEINVDSIPDAVLEPPHPAHSLPSTSSAYQASASTSASDFSKLLSPSSMQPYMSFLPPTNLALGFPPPLTSEPIHLSMQHLYENAYKKYISELSGGAPHSPLPSSHAPDPLTSTPVHHNKATEKPPPPPPPPPLSSSDDNDAPLDLSMSVKSSSSKTSSNSSSQERSIREERSISHNDRTSNASSSLERSFGISSLNSSSSKNRAPTPSSSFMEKVSRDFDHSRHSSYDDSNSETHSDFNDSHYQRDVGNSPSSPKQQNTANASGPMQKRYRTQMTSLQVKVMKLLFMDYKTPTMTECELLGKEIGLPKRVVQVWFQNARAKEKKSKLTMSKTLGTEVDFPKVPEECQLCKFKYSHKFTVQDHIFTKHHIDNAKAYIQNQSDAEREISDPSAVSGLLRQQSLDMESRLWDKTSTATSQQQLAQIQQGLNAAALGLSSAVPGLGNAFPLSGLPLPPEGGSKPTPSEKQKSKDHQKDSGKKTDTSVAPTPTSTSSNKEHMQHHHQQQQQQPSSQQAAELAHMMALGGFLPGLDPGYLNYMYSAGLPGFFPGMTAMPLLQPGLLPGAEHMLAYDAMSFGTPLHMLNLPEQAIKSVTQKVEDSNCTLAHYTQDCKTLSDLKGVISSFDMACFIDSSLDVGYICKKCHMVYPAREACLTHQRISCYVSGGHGGKTLLKLEQLQYECRVCAEKCSTISEVKAHCQEESHKMKVNQLGSSVLPSSSSHSTPSRSSPKPATLTPVHAASNSHPFPPGSSAYISDRVSSSVASATPSAFSPGKSPALALPLDGDKKEDSVNPKIE